MFYDHKDSLCNEGVCTLGSGSLTPQHHAPKEPSFQNHCAAWCCKGLYSVTTQIDF